ncbi:siroheme synthase CysG [Buchnera aphidicola]|uniref:siroheme synthase CysG n=1 Tax=Buchnera aphidicola TaxID=9 RepID=UPI0034648E6E
MNYLPISINLKSRPVLVVGGGEVAFRKVFLLLRTGAIINIVAFELCNDLYILYKQKKIFWISKNFHTNQLQKIFFVIVATSDNILNNYIFQQANRRYLLVNVVDDISKCSIIFPAIVDRNPIKISISSGGSAPVLCCMLRQKIESMLPHNFGDIAIVSQQWRKKIQKKFHNISIQRKFWYKLFNSIFVNHILNGNTETAVQILKKTFHKDYEYQGQVVLVGAGPGDKDLLTLKGLQALQVADIILYDSLVNKDILDFARRDSKLVFVGKSLDVAGGITQNQINCMLISLARKGKKVVRLKGGDGFIFGRGGEELEALKDAGVVFQVIPGITAAIGVAAYSGIPLTHRLYSSSVTFITGHVINKGNIDWKALSKNQDTIVIYMGKMNINNIYNNFILYKKSMSTPIAFIEKGTTFQQKILIGKLKNMLILSKEISSPSLLIVGNVVNLHKKCMWFHNK